MFKNIFYKEPFYKCILEKKVICPLPEGASELVKSLTEIKGYKYKLIRKFDLPFVPQAGVKLHKIIEMPNHETPIQFDETIRSVEWQDGKGDGCFVCHTDAHNMRNMDSLAISLLALLQKG